MTAMRFIRYNGIDQKIYEFLQNKNKRLMGICLGMQLLFDKSIESRPSPPLFMTEDDLVAKYAAEALASMKMEAEKRIEEVVDVELEEQEDREEEDREEEDREQKKRPKKKQKKMPPVAEPAACPYANVTH